MNDHDELERLLGQELTDRADTTPFGAGLDFDSVKGRAVRIRRTRRIAGAVAVAAAVAVIVPTTLAATGGLHADRDLQPTVPSPSAPIGPVRTTLTLDGLSQGGAPAIEYFTPDGVVLPDRGLVQTDQDYRALVPSEADGGPGGYVAVESDGQHLRVLTKDFQPQSGSATTQSFVTTTARDHYAFVTVEAGAQTLVSRDTTTVDGGTTWQLPAKGAAEVVGYLGDERILVENVDQTDGSSDLMIAEPDGSLTPVRGGYVSALSTSPEAGAFAVQTKERDNGGCFGVVDSTTFDLRWDTCDYKLGGFSPDGRYVLASSPSDGMGPRDVEVLDAATGHLVAGFTPAASDQLFMVGVAWETPDTFLAVAYDGTTGTILRMAVDGSLEEAVDPVHVRDVFSDRPFWLGYDRVHGL